MPLPWLVVGSAACVWHDLNRAPAYAGVVLVNRMMIDYPVPGGIGATLHHELAHQWARPGLRITSIRPDPGVDEVWEDVEHKHGSSGLYGVGVALRAGADRIVLAGIPMDGGPHHYDGVSALDPYLDAYRAAWLRIQDDLRGRVTSLSGWTKELLSIGE